ncbi:MAG: M67 family metallopeptidase [Terriglobia bacterium]
MALRIGRPELEAMLAHAAQEYPNECCGLLLGTAEEEVKDVQSTKPLLNLRRDSGRAYDLLPLGSPERESERNRFLIDPEDWRRADREARTLGIEIIGIYHSHPDHPARPSQYDLDHAIPWYSYVIIAVESGRPARRTSWILRGDRAQFDEEQLDVSDARAGDAANSAVADRSSGG